VETRAGRADIPSVGSFRLALDLREFDARPEMSEGRFRLVGIVAFPMSIGTTNRLFCKAILISYLTGSPGL
jgi:hypothetical protein